MPKISQSWKVLERYVARVLGGERVTRGADFSKSAPDVSHEYFTIECKYRTSSFKPIYDAMEQAKQYDGDKVPLVVIRRKGKKALAVVELEDFGALYNDAKRNK